MALGLVIAVFFSGCSLFKKDPQKAVVEGIAAFADVKKMSSKLTIGGTVNSPAGEMPAKVQFSLETVGASDASNEKSPKVDMAVKISGSADANSGSGELSFRTVDKKMFVNVSKISIPGSAGDALSTQLKSVLSTWWAVPLNDQNYFSKLTDQQKQLQEKLKTTPFFTNATEMGSEDVSGVASTRFRVDLDKDAVKKFILDLARTGGNQLKPEEEVAIGDSLKDVEWSGAVWVGDDNAVHRVQGQVVMRPAAGPSTTLDIDFTGWNYGNDVSIAAPDGAKDFNPLMLLPLLGAVSSINQQGALTPPATSPAPGASAVGAAGAAGAAIDSPLGKSQVKSKAKARP